MKKVKTKMREIKLELWKALHSRRFRIAVSIGLAIVMINVFENAILVERLREQNNEALKAGIAVSQSPLGFSLFIHWIAVNRASLGNNLFYFVWPIIAAMPYGWSYFEERKNGTMVQIVVRTGKKIFFISKYISIFISGGLAIAIPVLVNLLVNALICPYAIPKAVVPISLVTDGYFLSELYYCKPWLYSLIWCGMEFIVGGVAACVCLSTGTMFRYQVMTVIFPFVLFVFVDAILSLIRSVINPNINYSLINLASAASAIPNPENAVFFSITCLLLISSIAGYWQMVKHEIL